MVTIEIKLLGKVITRTKDGKQFIVKEIFKSEDDVLHLRILPSHGDGIRFAINEEQLKNEYTL